MPNFGQLLGVAGQVVGGYGIDKQRRLTDVLNQRKLAMEERRSSVVNALKPERQVVDGQVVDVDAATATPIAGLTGSSRKIVGHQIAQDGTPYNVYNDGVWEKAKLGGVEPPAPPAAATPAPDGGVPGAGPAPAVAPVAADTIPPKAPATPAPKFGTTRAPVAGSPEWEDVKRKEAQIALDVGATKLTEPQEKSYLFYNLMEKAQPQIDRAMTGGMVRKLAVSAYLNAPEMAQPLLNAKLNTEEQSLIRSFRDFAAGVLRKESGAAVTTSELREVWGRYGPGFGDQPGLDEEKSQARLDYMDAMKNQAGPAMEFYAKRQRGAAPSGGAASREQQLWDAAVAKHGQAKVLQSFGPRP